MFSIKNRKVLVTGGTSGIGMAVAGHMCSSGADVVILGRRDDGPQVAQSIGATFIRADVSNERQLKDAIDQSVQYIGILDVLILNAGADNTGQTIEEQSSAQLRELFAVNVEHLYSGLRHGPAKMANGGSIIITSSVAGLVTLPTYSQYAASKAAANSLARTAALELAPRKIRVNAVCPGGINTAMLHENHPERAFIEAFTPLGVIGETDDLLGVYQFLASDASRYMTGQTLAVDGGISAGFGYGILEKLTSA